MTTNYQKLKDAQRQLGGKLWTKNGKCRLYVDNFGYNTKKSQTSVYLYILDGNIKVEVFLDCPTQHWNWVKTERERIITNVKLQIKNLKHLKSKPVKFIPCSEARQTFSYTRTNKSSAMTPLYEVIPNKPKQ